MSHSIQFKYKETSARGRKIRERKPKYKSPWSQEDDQKLLDLVALYGENSWNRISKKIHGKSEIKCHTRWLDITNCSHFARGGWSKEEDRILTEIVNNNGASNWTEVAKSLPGRIGKQCRERWHNHLDPNIKKMKWTREEDILIVKLHLKHGNRWCDIAKEVQGRTDNAIKNRYNSNLSKRLHESHFASIIYGDDLSHASTVTD